MAERYEKIDADNLLVIVESEYAITKERLTTMLSNLEKEKQKTQADIDSVQARLSILD